MKYNLRGCGTSTNFGNSGHKNMCCWWGGGWRWSRNNNPSYVRGTNRNPLEDPLLHSKHEIFDLSLHNIAQLLGFCSINFFILRYCQLHNLYSHCATASCTICSTATALGALLRYSKFYVTILSTANFINVNIINKCNDYQSNTGNKGPVQQTF